jgi:hypothetical protein
MYIYNSFVLHNQVQWALKCKTHAPQTEHRWAQGETGYL